MVSSEGSSTVLFVVALVAACSLEVPDSALSPSGPLLRERSDIFVVSGSPSGGAALVGPPMVALVAACSLEVPDSALSPSGPLLRERSDIFVVSGSPSGGAALV